MQSKGYAVVTGGGSGIGRAFCLALASQGWRVAVADCCGDSASAVANEISNSGGHASPHLLDVSDAENWRALYAELKRSWPAIDLLVNNAGNLITGSLDACSSDDLRRIVEVNLLGTMHGCHAMLPWLRESTSTATSRSISKNAPRGVINMASIFAAVSPPGFAAYNATKAGVLALTETIRGELKPHGLNATAVLPGVTPTKLFTRARYADAKHSAICNQFVATSRITSDQVAAEALAGAARGRLYVVVGGRSKWYWRLKRLAPQRLIDKVGRRAIDTLGPPDKNNE